jgi:hypothetical protein
MPHARRVRIVEHGDGAATSWRNGHHHTGHGTCETLAGACSSRAAFARSWSFEIAATHRRTCVAAGLARTFTHTVAHMLPGPPTLNLYLRGRILISLRPFAFIVFSPDSGAHCDQRCPADVRNPIEKHSTRPLTFLPLTHHTLFWYAFPFFSSVSAAACSSPRP